MTDPKHIATPINIIILPTNISFACFARILADTYSGSWNGIEASAYLPNPRRRSRIPITINVMKMKVCFLFFIIWTSLLNTLSIYVRIFTLELFPFQLYSIICIDIFNTILKCNHSISLATSGTVYFPKLAYRF